MYRYKYAIFGILLCGTARADAEAAATIHSQLQVRSERDLAPFDKINPPRAADINSN